jgi:branched-chain amino acid transport system permease protein
MSTLHTIVNQLVNGLATGSLYALVGSGVAIIWGVVGLVNFAQGQFYLVGCYIVVFLLAARWPYALVIIAALLGMGVFGASVQWVVIRPIVRQPWQSQLVATLGLSVLITALLTVLIGAQPYEALTPLTASNLNLGGWLFISLQRVLLIIGTGCAFFALWLFLKYHRMGRAMRAMSQNRDACAAAGIEAQPISMLTFAIGAGLAGLAAALYAPLTTTFPTGADVLIIKAFVVVIMGGLGRVDATVAAALVLGVAEAFTAQYITVTYVDVVAAILMVAFILWRPQGLFGRKVGI